MCRGAAQGLAPANGRRLGSALQARQRFEEEEPHAGGPVVIFSSIVGTSLFATLADPEAGIPPAFKITVGSISVAAALQTFLRFGERAQKHVVAADWYTAVRRDIDQLLALSAKERGTPKICFDRIRKDMSKIGQQSPEIGDRLWKVMAARYHVRNVVPATSECRPGR
ncbi:MAG: SLATT domain-containing protein [Beggiatoa sp.]|nr:SLATT domain-containing protein [Beggiatoa sp.]